MPTEDPLDQIRHMVDKMTSSEVASTLEQILALGAAGQLSHLEPVNPPIHLPDPPAEGVALTVRVDVDDVSPKVWRRLVLRGDLTLAQMHGILQAAFGWLDSHLHRFWPGPRRQLWRGPYFLTDYDVEEGDEGTLEADVRLDQVLREAGDRLFYTYDFGDGWTHTLRLESVEALDQDAPPAVCTRARNAGPLEDSGGPHGYNELVAAHAADPSLAQLEDYLREWVPSGWDPRDVDVNEVNEQVQGMGLSPDNADDDSAGFTVFGARREKGWPAALEALQGNLAQPVAARITALCERASAADGHLSEQDLAVIARPFRYLVELAGEDGIPLTQAGWIKPALVKQILTDLDLDQPWLGRSHQEVSTPPVRNLRDTCQDLGLLRKRKDRLLASRKAKALASDRDYLTLLTGSLLVHKNSLISATHGLFTLCLAAGGAHNSPDLAVEVADLLLACGINFGTPGEIDPWDVMDVVRTTWMFLNGGSGETGPDGQRHAVALSKAALWPDDA